jgi:hypothetical protein
MTKFLFLLKLNLIPNDPRKQGIVEDSMNIFLNSKSKKN